MDVYCLRCKRFMWDENEGRCLNQFKAPCPMAVKAILKSLDLDCRVM